MGFLLLISISPPGFYFARVFKKKLIPDMFISRLSDLNLIYNPTGFHSRGGIHAFTP